MQTEFSSYYTGECVEERKDKICIHNKYKSNNYDQIKLKCDQLDLFKQCYDGFGQKVIHLQLHALIISLDLSIAGMVY